MATHSASQDLTPDISRFDFCRKVKHGGLKRPTTFATPLAEGMKAEGQNTGSVAFPENKEIPAGYTFVGQWLAHDITMARNLGLPNPLLRLLTLYGAGPSAMTGAFAHHTSQTNRPGDFDDPAMRATHLKQEVQYETFRHAKFNLKFEGADQYDVPRLPNQIAIMADNRNDQHFLLCQLHCAFARFHNALTEWLHYLNYPYMLMSPHGVQIKGEQLFTLAREIVVWCYQRMLVEDFLPKLLLTETVDSLKEPKPSFKLFKEDVPPQLMPEFSLAAMRVGHSQTKEVYQVNRAGDRFSIFSNQRGVNDLRGFKEHELFHFEWDVFFKISDEAPQASAAIDHWISKPLSELIFRPRNANNLAAINLERSVKLPTGDSLAAAAGFVPLKITEPLKFGTENIPLWLYILLEAELTQKGERLGELGSRIIGEQIMWVLRHDSMSKYSSGGACDTLEKFVGELFNKYELNNFFGSPDVLTAGLEQLGMNQNSLDMAWIIKFPAEVASQIGGLGNAINDFHRNGPAALESTSTKLGSKGLSTQKQTIRDLLKKVRAEATKTSVAAQTPLT